MRHRALPTGHAAQLTKRKDSRIQKMWSKRSIKGYDLAADIRYIIHEHQHKADSWTSKNRIMSNQFLHTFIIISKRCSKAVNLSLNIAEKPESLLGRFMIGKGDTVLRLAHQCILYQRKRFRR
jgi:hypothetical protein